MRSRDSFSILPAVAISWAAMMGASTFAQQPQGTSDPSRVKEQRQAYANGGLAAAAAITGSFVNVEVGYRGAPISLDEFIAQGSNVLVGEFVGGRPELTKRGDSVVTRTQFRVREVIKGPKAETVEILLPGGRVSFSNGTWAEVHVRDARLPMSGHVYLLVLERDSVSGGSLVPRFGQLGIIDVTDQTALPRVSIDRQGSHSSFVAWLLRKNYTARQLLTDVRSIAKAK